MAEAAAMEPARDGSSVPVVCAVLVALVVFSAIRSPVPGVNEPHFLAKARHLVDPDWCPHDFFLESSNPHLAFYVLVGPLTRLFPLAVAAWIGRVLALLLLATGWVALTRRLIPGTWSAWPAICVFLLASAIGHISGEWVVGGVEAKVFAYGLLLWSAAAAIDTRGRRAAVFTGLAISMHPIVGGWGLACGLFASGTRRLFRPIDRATGPHHPFFEWFIRGALLTAAALPGLLPAIGLLGRGSVEADHVQLFARLPHHLVPSGFSVVAIVAYACLLVAWFASWSRMPRAPWHNWWSDVVVTSAVIAIIGAMVAHPDAPLTATTLDRVRLTVMKFYPFRLLDVLLPAAAALAAAAWLARPNWRRARTVLPVACLALALLLPAVDRNPSRMPPQRRADWLATCDFVDGALDQHARVLTPRNSWAFKWYAERAEFVVFKDCPQDARGLLEWKRRIDVRDRWLRLFSTADARSQRMLAAHLSATEGITHIIWRRTEQADQLNGLVAIDTNRSFIVYRTAAAVSG